MDTSLEKDVPSTEQIPREERWKAIAASMPGPARPVCLAARRSHWADMPARYAVMIVQGVPACPILSHLLHDEMTSRNGIAHTDVSDSVSLLKSHKAQGNLLRRKDDV